MKTIFHVIMWCLFIGLCLFAVTSIKSCQQRLKGIDTVLEAKG